MTPAETLAARARDMPRRLAFEVDGEEATFAALGHDVARLAAALASQRLGPGDHCAVALPTSLDFVRVLFALSWMGAVPVAVDPGLPAAEIAARLQAAGCRVLVGASPLLETVSEVLRKGGASRGGGPLDLVEIDGLRAAASGIAPHPLHRGAAGDTAYLQFTSGTTGEARAAVILQRSLQASLESATSLLRFGPEDVMAGTIPLHHNFGLVRFVWTPVHAGCACHLAGQAAGSVHRWLALMTTARATVTSGPDFLYRAAAQRGDPRLANLRALRFASNGGESVRLDTITAFEERFGVPGTVRPGYGLTEATLGVCTLAPGLPVKALDDGTLSCGPPMPGVDVRVADEDGVERPRGARGEILVRGPSLFAGYYGDPEGTRAVLRDGWLRTGDQGTMDDEGFVFVTGRQRALIKRAGAPILPAAIERAVDAVPGVVSSAAIGVPDASTGTDRIVVLAELDDAERASRSSAALAVARSIAAAAEKASGHQPGEIILLHAGALPRTGSGKPRHGALREVLARGEVERHLSVIARLRRG